eukprot:TRINITY_DN24511_c0_g2_i1.p1 TRINITY_DN24511_c0_g2~~TRINITY_DN24511_c0_g2_i1.p1  ORF type:complete len:467 (-),score=46.91 TRINITY_DN24511_c0_g2_i1:68-1297(-)
MHDYVMSLGLSTFQRTMASSLVFFATAVGNALAGYVGDFYGRKRAILIGSSATSFGLSLLACCPGAFVVYILGALCSGIGIGLTGPACWALIGEVSPAKDRTFLGGLSHVAWSMGALFILIPSAFHVRSSLLLSCSVLLAFLYTSCVCCLVVESPVYLAHQGEFKRASLVLDVIWARNGRERVRQPGREWNFSESSIEPTAFYALLADPVAISAILASSAILACVNYSHYGVMYVMPKTSPVGQVPSSVVAVVMSAVAAIAIMRYGHAVARKQLVFTLLLASAALSFLFLTFAERAQRGTLDIAILSYVYFAMLNATFILVCLYTMEVSRPSMRVTCLGMAMMISRIGAIAGPFVLEVIGTSAFLATMVISQAACAKYLSVGLKVESNMRQLSELAAETQLLFSKGIKV